ncbi:MAG TPA: hypothetical protein VND91_09090 [Candidatus Saccharimonadia bacterium]|nr:hypothetical protein [Candidatus Saccharimonadia bacterium]
MFAAALVLGLHLAFGWMMFGPDAPEEPTQREPGRPADHLVDGPDPLQRAAPARPDRAPSRPHDFEPGAPAGDFASPTERAAYERGVSYELARRESLARQYDRAYGEEIGAIMRLPLPNAWHALESLAAQGDEAAADALLVLSACTAEIPERGDTYRRARANVVEGLAPADAAFVHGALDTELLAIESDARTCKTAGLDGGRLVSLAEQRLRAQDRSEPPPTGANAHAWIDYYRRAFSAPEVSLRTTEVGSEASAWLERLDAALSPEQWAQFRREAPEHPALAMRVAYCAMSRCPDLPSEAWSASDRYIDRAAEYGFPQAISHVIDRHAAASGLAQAHAWAEFGMWVTASGCFPIAQSLEYAQLARQRALLAARLTPPQFAEARQMLAVLMRSHGNAALAAQGCTP